VSDAAGNAATPVVRLVKIICPVNETLCTDPSSGQLTCTLHGICGISSLGITVGTSLPGVTQLPACPRCTC
jgi:hypothetical protein